MRNLIEFPIQSVEILQALETAIERHRKLEIIGGTEGYCLHVLEQYLIDNPEILQDIVEKARV